ncbi:hypothetical protein [Salinarimonas soli]|uniref:Exonuclease domain-containing protein n=1 Tax=Salinarimonas soli TaxID=1638099 RepID=A0A5B2V8R2_9HYPH|nr:hypothetical protein [Salinarimonas soli]KAA2235883.1 hypothetical protein F0L46_17750 [Salinarimonas soli]
MNRTPVLPWPLYTIDFEASSLEPGGYPIEVGLAFWGAPDEPVYSWSTLICPTDEWTQHGDWSKASRAVHGISQAEAKAHGRPPSLVAKAVSEALTTCRVLWCDGGPYDAQWARALFKPAGLRLPCPLGDWHQLLRTLDNNTRDRALHWIEQTPAEHRARADAELLLLALAHGIQITSRPTLNLEDRIPALVLANARTAGAEANLGGCSAEKLKSERTDDGG